MLRVCETKEWKLPLRLTEVYMLTFARKIGNGQRELVLRGPDIEKRHGRRIEDRHVPLITDFLADHPEVVSLDLAYNEITNLGMEVLVEFLKNYSSVLRLNVMCNEIGSRAMTALLEAAEHTSLESLRINGNRIGVEGCKCLALFVRYARNLKYLDVGETDQTMSSLAYFTGVLHEENGLELIDLSRPLGPWHYHFYPYLFADSLGQMFKVNEVLREVHLQKCELTDHDVEILLPGLMCNRTLRLLDLSCNALADDAADHLGRYLKTKPPLLGLMLAHNHIKDTGARGLCFTMPYSRLKLLDVSYNSMTDLGISDILHTIKKEIPMLWLFMWGNTITYKTTRIIRRMLLSGVLDQERIDIKVYNVDGRDYCAFYPTNRYNALYYCSTGPLVMFDKSKDETKEVDIFLCHQGAHLQENACKTEVTE